MQHPSPFHVLVGALAVEVAMLGTLHATGRGGAVVREWYRTFGASAVGMDVASAAFAAQLGVTVAGTAVASGTTDARGVCQRATPQRGVPFT